MRKKWLLLAGLLMVLTLCAGIASAAENSTTATIDLQFGKQTFTDTVQVEWNERYIYGELDKLYLSEDEFYSYEEEELLFSVCCDRKNARIELYDETDTFISIMYDDGTHGDITANDGVYSCSYVIKTDKVTRISYYAVFGNSRSNDVTAYFYSAPSSNHYSQYEDIITAIKDIERPYTDENGFVLDADSAQQAFKSVLEYLKQEYNKYSIIKLDVTEHTIEFTLPYGLQIFYEPTFKNCLSQGNSTDQIITVLTSNEITLGNLYRHKLREAASELDAALVNYRYDETSDMYDVQDRDVTLFTVCDELLCPNSVILWAGHGGYLREIGCAIGTTEKFTDTTIDKYSRFSIVKNREYVVSGKGIIFFTPAFVRNECNLTGSFVYFQCCHSAERGTDDWMAEACCIDAGADAYAGNLGETEQAYAYGFLYDVIKRMTEVNPSNGKLYTLGEAQQYAYDMPYWDIWGSMYYASDPNYRFKENKLPPTPTLTLTPMPTLTPTPTLTSNLSCTVVDKNTHFPLNATVTLIPRDTSDESAIIQVQDIGNTGILEMGLDAGNYELQVSMDGYLTHTEIITMTNGSTVELNVALEQIKELEIIKGTLNGRVMFNSAGVNNIKINILSGLTYAASLTTNDAGQFSVDLEPGTYMLEIDVDGYMPVRKSVKVFAKETTTEDIELIEFDEPLCGIITHRLGEYNISYYELVLKNQKGSLLNLGMKLTLSNGIVLIDTANGIRNGITQELEDRYWFTVDDSLIQGSVLELFATDSLGRQYHGEIVMAAGWKDGQAKTLITQ